MKQVMVIDIQTQRVTDGEDEGFHRLVEDTRKELYQLLLNLTQNHHDAEDILQETYLRAYRAMSDFRGESTLFTWLYRIALNEALTRRRRQGHAPFTRTGLETPAVQAMPAADDLETEFEQRRLNQRVQVAMTQLSPTERAVFILRHHLNYSVQQTAEILGNAEGSVKNLHFRAIRKLRDVLLPNAAPEVRS